MTSVFFDTNALYIEGYRDSFTAGTLTFDLLGNQVGVRVQHGTEYLVEDNWSVYTRQDGSTFVSLNDLTDYLTAQFAMRRPVGSPQRNYAVPVNDGQTVFPISPAPVDVNTINLVVNGAVYAPPDISVSASAVTWQGVFSLASSDAIRVIYF